MEKSTKMVEEITEKRKIKGEVKEKIFKNILYNFLLSIGIICYICGFICVYVYCSDNIYDIVSKVLSMFSIIITVIVFEFAYKKDSGKFAINGIELLVASIVVLYMPKMFINLDKFYSQIFLLTPLYCAIYFVAKGIIIYKKEEKIYQNSLSDVKEILKEETKV